ncbi:TetR/AcrR family transcriptional regulator [Streptomyces triticagri]|nr:TetR/AcrR family transcriptional regulator [Streptomyces triticagri]
MSTSEQSPPAPVTDGRLLRGARSRQAVLRRAVDLASLDGLEGLSLGRLAAELSISKSGVQTLFGSKEKLQAATVEAARRLFHDAVVAPASGVPQGAARVRALVERWIDYAREPLFTGGCFWAANLADFDSRPGRVHDALFGSRQEWRDLLAAELSAAADAGEIVELDAAFAAFQIDAVLLAANTALRTGDTDPDLVADRIRRTVEAFLAEPARG